MGYRSIIAAIALTACATAAAAADLVFSDRGRMPVVDAAHILPPADAAELNARVAAWDNATGHQLAIATVPTLQGREIADYGYRLGRAWGLGRKGINDGILFLIAPAEHRVRIDVGRGLEGDLTDAETSVILHDEVVPKLKAGDDIGAVSAGADAIMRAVPAGAGDMANAPKPSTPFWTVIVSTIFGSFIGIALVALIYRRRREATRAAKAEQTACDRRYGYAPAEGDPAKLAIKRQATFAHGARYSSPPRYVSPLPPFTGKSDPAPAPRAPTTIIAPVIINGPSYSPPPSYSSDSTSGWGSGDSGSSSAPDFGSSSSGFDSGGGNFGGGGSDSSW